MLQLVETGKQIELFNILDKFKKIEIKSTQKISNEDLAYCEKTQSQYEKAVEQINFYMKALQSLHDKDPNKLHEFYSYRNGVETIRTVRELEWNERHFFTPLYGIYNCKKYLTDLKKNFINKIKNYFESSYNLKLDLKSLDECEKEIHYTDIIELIIDCCGGISLNETGLENLKEEFRNRIYYQNRVKKKNNKISLDNYVYYRYYSLPELRIDFDDKQLPALLKAMSFFETNNITVDPIIASGLPNPKGNYEETKVDVTKEYTLTGTNKVKSIRFFKNRRIDIKFNNSQDAEDFYNCFELYKLPEK